MGLTVQFKHMTPLKHLEQTVKSLVARSIEKYESWRSFDTTVVIGTVRGRSASQPPVFECDVRIHGTGLKQPIVVKKENSNFYEALSSGVKASEKQIRRSYKKRLRLRRRLAA